MAYVKSTWYAIIFQFIHLHSLSYSSGKSHPLLILCPRLKMYYIKLMGKIRSAWEIALERTENIEVDENRIRHQNTIDKIRRIAGSFLMQDQCDEEALSENLREYSAADLREGLMQSILNGLGLPQEKVEDDRYERLHALLEIASGENADAEALFDQITGFLKQYPLHREQLVEQLKAQAEPMLREKEAQMKEKYGQDLHLSLENDKDFMNILEQNLKRLDDQYNQTLAGAKEQLKSILG